MLDWITEQLHNPLFSGLIGASGIGAVAYYLREIPAKAKAAFVYGCIVRMTVTNDDDSFSWINQWLSRQTYGRRARNLKLSTFYFEVSDFPPAPGETVDDSWTLAPGPGKHWFCREGRPVLVERQSETTSGSYRKIETITISAFGRDAGILRRIVNEARQLRRGNNRTEIWRWKSGWRRTASRLPRPVETVAMSEEQKQRILRDAERFFVSADWYAQRGVPYRRGYLFEGDPGTGKTSMVLALAGHFRRPLYVLNLGSLASDDHLIEALSDVPSNGIVLIEDIDGTGAAVRRKVADDDDEEKREPLTMSAMLNVIDGAFASDGRLLIMTTNHPERLDPAMLRPGRVDLRERFDVVGPGQIIRMFRRFYPAATAFELPRIAQRHNPAEVQAIMLRHMDDPAAAAAELSAREAA